MLRRRVVVHLKDGLMFEGTLDFETPEGVALMLTKFENSELPGHTFIYRSDIRFVQAPPGEALR